MPTWLFGSLRGYQRSWLSGDLAAGLTVWAVLVPEALAYASIAGVSPVIGLYAAPGALLLYAVFGSSRHLVVGPMSATAALSAAAVADVVSPSDDAFVTMTAALAITSGIIGVAAGLLRLGFVANFISEPVLKGFIVGLALTIIIGQVPKLFGVEKGEGDFFEQLWDVVSQPNVAVLGRPTAAQGHWVDLARHPEDEQVPGIVVLRVESGLFFANAEHLRGTLQRAIGPDTRAVVLDAETVPFIDVTAAEMLLRLRDELAGRGIALVLARGVGQVRDVLERSADSDVLAPGVYPSVAEAVAALQAGTSTATP